MATVQMISRDEVEDLIKAGVLAGLGREDHKPHPEWLRVDEVLEALREEVVTRVIWVLDHPHCFNETTLRSRISYLLERVKEIEEGSILVD